MNIDSKGPVIDDFQVIDEFSTGAADKKAVLTLTNITKTFPAVVALSNVNLSIYRGEVHALMGENGAGKSTLMKVLAGTYQPNEGDIHLEGQKVVMDSPLAAKHKGVVLVHQELSLAPDLSVAENIFLGSLPQKAFGQVDWKKLYADTDRILAKLKCNFKASTLVRDLPIAKKQMVEIGRALVFTPKVVVFDEPTASLTDTEKVVLFDVINDLRKQDVAIVYISHRMDEIFELSNRLSVLRDGEYRNTVFTAETNEDEVTKLMIGRSLEGRPAEDVCTPGDTKLEVKNLTVPGLFQNINFKLRVGEVVGMYGLVGAGRTEIAETLFGLREASAGDIFIDGQKVTISSPRDAVAKGLALVPESRKEQGLVLGMNCKDNTTLSQLDKVSSKLGWIDGGKELEIYNKYEKMLAVKTPHWSQKVGNLSGGNQQKIVIGKWLSTHPKVLILDEPTRGIDVGSKAEIHRLIRELAKSGYAVLVISSEMPEVIGVSDRVIALYDGNITAEFDGATLTEDQLVQAITA
jgi:ABC-type sugar transport system ATPase subunit